MHDQRRTRLSRRLALTRHVSPRGQGWQRPWPRRFVACVAIVGALVLAAPPPTQAHPGGSVGIALSAERLPPGGPLELIGIDFQPHETLDVVIGGPSGRISIGPVTAGPDGHFQFVLPLPETLRDGPYTIDVISRSGIVQREIFAVDRALAPPALTPTPVELRTHSAPTNLLDPWALPPLVAIGVVAVLFLKLARRSGAAARDSTSSGAAGPA